MSILKGQSVANGLFGFTFISFAICMNVLTTSSAQKGFLSIDCGSTENYTDSFGLKWVTDSGTFIDTGSSFEQTFVNSTLLNSSTGGVNQALTSFRYFPDRRSKYCYELETKSNISYLIRASFYMNEDEYSKRKPFQFITHVNATQWFTVRAKNDSQSELLNIQEAIFYSPGTVMYFCLQPVVGVPFISSLEIRELEATMYSYSGSQLQYLPLLLRYNMGDSTTPEVVRFPDDSYDRIWKKDLTPCTGDQGISCVSVRKPIDTAIRADVNNVPPRVMQDALLLSNNGTASGGTGAASVGTWSSDFYESALESLTPPEYAFTVVYVEDLNSSDSRPYGMTLYLTPGTDNLNPGTSTLNISTYLDYPEDYITEAGSVTGQFNVSKEASMQAIPNLLLTGDNLNIDFDLAPDSNHEGLLPLNAVEAYSQYNFNFSITNPTDVEVISAMKKNFSLTNWQGDPCTPVPFDELECASANPGHMLSTYVVTSLSISNLRSPSGMSFFNDPNNIPYVLWEEMDVSYNAIDYIPSAEYWQPTYLLSLNLSNNRLTKLDPLENYYNVSTGWSRAFEWLEHLDLSYNNMTSLPDPAMWINSTGNLIALNLSHNQLQGDLSSLNEWFQENSGSLTELYISNNKLGGEFPSSLYFEGLPTLITASPALSGFLGWKASQSGALSFGSLVLLCAVFYAPPPPLKIFDENPIEGTLDLSIWYDALQKAANDNSTRSNVTFQLFSFVNNSISDIIPSADAFGSTMDVLLKDSSFSQRGILLGGNPYCEGANSYAQRYLCRSSINDVVLDTQKHNKDIMIIAISLGVFAFLVSCITLASMWKLWKQVHALREIQQALADQKVQPPFYEYNDLRRATRDFHKDNKLGQGGFGVVYMGVLEDETMLAVKMLFTSKKSQVLNEFLNEVVLITGIKHRNLVQLKGCCIKDKQRMLVYEYAEKGNLAQALWGSKAHGALNWQQRFSICVGIAKGLSYLHEELQPSIIHRDIKPENILLDKNLQPKIADFGLARNFSDKSSQALYTKVAGTFGYFSPEYATLGELSEKVDVYSFGIVVLEVVSGRPCIDHSLPLEKRFLKYWAQKMHKKGILVEILQPELRDNCVIAEVSRALRIGLLCVQDDPRRRPSMSEVITMFMGNMDVEVFLKEHEDDDSDFKGLSTYSEMQYRNGHSNVIEADAPTSFLLGQNSESSSSGSSSLSRARSMIEMRSFFLSTR